MLPSQEKVKTEILKELDSRNVPRMCENCAIWDRYSTRCGITGKPMPKYMFCLKHEFKTEKLEREAMEYLKEEQLECEKIENLLAMMLTCAGMTTCVAEDFEKRTRRLYDREKEKRTKQLLRKDLNVGEDIINAYETILEHLRKIDQQFRFYVYPHEKRALTREGKFDIKKTDGHLSNQFELLRVLFKIVKKVLGSKEKFDQLMAFIDSMEDSPGYALTDQDINHYELK